jgi:hypothetical protein
VPGIIHRRIEEVPINIDTIIKLTFNIIYNYAAITTTTYRT